MCRRYVPSSSFTFSSLKTRDFAEKSPAPQKIAYMADSFWKQSPPAQKPHSTFSSGMPTMFSVPHYSRVLDAIREEKGITGIFNQNLIEVRPDDKTAVFEVMTGEKKGERVEKEYGMLHVTPPMGPVDFVKSSALADGAGWVDVDAGTLQHKKYENVFSLGDASSLPTSKVRFSVFPSSFRSLTSAYDRLDCSSNNRPIPRPITQPPHPHVNRHPRSLRRDIRRLHLVSTLHRPRRTVVGRVQIRLGAKRDVWEVCRSIETQSVNSPSLVHVRLKMDGI